VLTVLALVVFGVIGAAGLRCSAKSAFKKAEAPEAPPAPVAVGPAQLQVNAASTGQPRMVLDAGTKDALRRAAADSTPAWQALAARCEELLRAPLPAGYEAFNWANAIASLSLCWHATGEERYSAGGVGYLQALVDDRYKVGDGKGGDHVVQHDNGYGIRTFGAYSALGYDWLRGAPDLKPELQRRIADRLDAWLAWYGEKGYLRDNPISNYFWGYLTTLTFAGVALHGDNPQAAHWLETARGLLSKQVLPVFREKLRGGYWPEGWQYGEYTALEIALVALTFKSAARVDIVRQLPWLAETVPYHIHALSPDQRHVYDGGTWTSRPAKPSALAMSGVALALDGHDDDRAKQARWLVRRVLPPLAPEQTWITFLTDRPKMPEKDPRSKHKLSYHAAGSGVTLLRSDWSSAAVWASFQAGPRLAADHQHKDEGHFTLWRGADALLVDGGGSEGDATINHNTILVDDGGRCMTYTPNQGVFGKKVRTTRFADDGQVAVVVGDIGEAYAPACARQGCEERAVSKLVRSMVYVRPSLVVVHDSIEVTKEDDGTTWAAHVTTEPQVNGSRVSAVVGRSRVDVQSLWPDAARVASVKEPTESGEGVHRKNQPWGPMWRIEIEAPRRDTRRTFLQVITADEASAKPRSAQRLAGQKLIGARAVSADKAWAVVFAEAEDGGQIALTRGVNAALVAGLAPGKRYRAKLSADRDCALELRAAQDGNLLANPGGFVKIDVAACR
jgi:hypothetical protein